MRMHVCETSRSITSAYGPYPCYQQHIGFGLMFEMFDFVRTQKISHIEMFFL